MSLLSIPRELLDDITRQLLGDSPVTPTPPKDLLNLAQTCSLLRSVCLSFIYRNVTTAAVSGKLECLLTDFPPIASHVRFLTVQAPEYRYADTIKINSSLIPFPICAAESPPLDTALTDTVPTDPPTSCDQENLPPYDPALKTLDLSGMSNPPAPLHAPTPWLYAILSNCTSLTSLTLKQPRSRRPHGKIPANFRYEFLKCLTPSLFSHITTIRFHDFRVTGLLSQIRSLLQSGFSALHSVHIERFSLADPPSFQESTKVAKQLEEVALLTRSHRLLHVRYFTLSAPARRPARLEAALGALLAAAMPAVEVLRMHAGADCIHGYLRVAARGVRLREVILDVTKPAYSIDGKHREDFCRIVGGMAPRVSRFVLRCGEELRVCEKLFVDVEWAVLKEMEVRCGLCEGAKVDMLKKCVQGRGLERGKVSVSAKKVAYDNHGDHVPIEMFGRLGLGE